MPDETTSPNHARIERTTQTRTGPLLRTLHLPPEGSPIPDDQIDLPHGAPPQGAGAPPRGLSRRRSESATISQLSIVLHRQTFGVSNGTFTQPADDALIANR